MMVRIQCVVKGSPGSRRQACRLESAVLTCFTQYELCCKVALDREPILTTALTASKAC